MITAQITGAADVAEALKGLGVALKARIAKEAIITGATIVEGSARAYARSSVDTGNLRDSIGIRVSVPRGKAVVRAVIGPRRGFKRTARDGSVRDAARNANLTEFGHMSDSGKQVAARPFMRPAFAQTKGAVMNEIAGVFRARVEKEAARLARKKARGK